MGCPPDPMEVSIWHSKERTQEKKSQNNVLATEIKSVKEKIGPLISLSEKHAAVAELWKQAGDAISALGSPEFTTYGGNESQNDFESEVYKSWNKEEYEDKMVKHHESILCIYRDFLIKAINIPGVKETLPSEMIEVHSSLLANQHVHREEDRKTWISWLQSRVKVEREWIKTKDIYTPEEKVEAKARIRKMEAEIKRVRSLDIETIVGDRYSFGQNPEYFDPGWKDRI